MRTIETVVYKFEELSDKAKDKALEKLWDINVSYEWWDYYFDEAKNLGFVITRFDERSIDGKLKNSMSEICRKIMIDHGDMCETYKTAQSFLTEWDSLVAKYSDGKNLECVTEENADEFDEKANDLEAEYFRLLLEDYRILLNKDYEYLTSREAIEESIRSNEYEFTEDGKLI